MENLTLDQFNELAQETASPSISMFLPTHRVGQDTQQDPIRFNNLIRDAEKQLRSSGMRPREVSELLKPAEALLSDTYFWMHQYEGLAVFMTSEDFHSYRLPFRVEELLIIARSYYIKPVLPLFTNNGHYYILAISQDEVRLFEGTRHSVGLIDLPDGTPQSLDEALQLDDLQKQLQFRTATSQGGMGGSLFHGQGPGNEEQKVWIGKYLSLVDDGLNKIFRQQQAPLILAGVDYLLSIYRRVSEYTNIMQEGIKGSPEHLRPEELQEKAWPIVEAYFLLEMEKVVEKYQQLADTDKATDDIEQIVAAALYGRVDNLLLSVGAQVWGIFNPDTGKVTLDSQGKSNQDNLELLDLVAMKTLQNGGTVYALDQEEMLTDSPIAAVFRY